MPKRETRPVSERRTDLGSSREVAARALLLLVLAAGVGGIVLAVYGINASRMPLVATGGGLVLAAAVVRWVARTFLASALADLKVNRFKPKREPKD